MFRKPAQSKYYQFSEVSDAVCDGLFGVLRRAAHSKLFKPFDMKQVVMIMMIKEK